MSVAEPGLPGAVLFDLDGTLIDSVPDITLAVNELMALDGLAPFDEDTIRGFVGHGLEKLVERAYAARDFHPEDWAGRLEAMRGIYARHLTGRTVLMPGVPRVLSQLRQAGWQLAVVTNKIESATLAILEHYGLLASFETVVGDAGLPHKPAPDMLEAALGRLGVPKRQAVMVGDSSADILAAKAAGLRSVAVLGGYTTLDLAALEPDRVIGSLEELPAILPGLLPAAAQ